MRAVIIGNGNIEDYGYIRGLIKSGDTVICADGGLRHAAAMGIRPDIAIGDFDSSERADGIETYEFPVRKDCTDGELAVEYAVDKGFSEILLLGMTGNRIDHMLTNIFLIFKGERITLADEHNEIYGITGGERLTLSGKKGKTLSIIPVNGDLAGIVTEGLEYPLRNETLYFGRGRGNSNVVTADVCSIRAKSGMAAVIVNNGE